VFFNDSLSGLGAAYSIDIDPYPNGHGKRVTSDRDRVLQPASECVSWRLEWVRRCEPGFAVLLCDGLAVTGIGLDEHVTVYDVARELPAIADLRDLCRSLWSAWTSQ
jgi:hypothetical protein